MLRNQNVRPVALLVWCAFSAAFVDEAESIGPAVPQPVVAVNLDGELEGRAGGESITAALGPQARFVRSVEGQGVAPGEQGPAVIVPVPDRCWRSAGTLAFWFRPSRTICSVADRAKRPQPLVLAECPLLQVELFEEPSCVSVRVTFPADGDAKRRRAGSLMWSRLEREQWYHLAIAWDAGRGELELYLNGVRQQAVDASGPNGTWNIPAPLAGPLCVGGSTGAEDTALKTSVDSIALYDASMNEDAIAAVLKGRRVPALQGEGRTDYAGELDLAPYQLELVYDADFRKPLDVIEEKDLCDGQRRVRLPVGKDWVLEGPGAAWTSDGRLWLESHKPEEGGHVVLWNTRVFPEEFLLEFGMSPKDSEEGLNIVFVCAASRQGGGIFDLDLPRRDGVFRNYHSGALDSYHVSYWAAGRRTANVRKNFGFFLVSCGVDRIDGQGAGPHRVRVLKAGGKLCVETRGRLAAVFADDGATYGPVLKSGAIGLRQMGHTDRASYSHFKVWRVEPRDARRWQ